MTEIKKEPKVLELLPEYKPTQKQIDRVMQNWKLILDPEDRFTNKDLCDVIDNDIPCLSVIAFFVVNSCVRGLKSIEDEAEKKELVTLVGKKMSQLKDETILRDITEKIYTVLSCPVAFWKNEGFMQIWCELLEISIGMHEKERVAQKLAPKVQDSPSTYKMQTTNEMVQDRMNLAALYQRREISNQFTTQVIQPIQSSYSPNQELRIVLQRSKHFIKYGDIKLMFRPVIQFNQDTLPNVAMKSFLLITPHKVSDFFQVSSITFNGNQILAQTSVSLSHGRYLATNYINSLVQEEKHKIDGEDATIGGGISFPGQLGTNVGFEENSITHPWTGTEVTGAPGQAGNLNLNYSKWEYDYYPRGILSKAWTYNQEMNIPDVANKWTWGNVYYSGWNYLNGGPVPTVNSGYWPTSAYAGQATPSETVQDTAIQAGSASFPLMPLMVTSSIAQYTQINTRLQKLRMRFVTANTTAYIQPGSANNTVGACWTIQSDGENTGTGYWAGEANNATVTDSGPIGVNTVALQKICYGTSVQGPLGTGQCVPGSNNIVRQLDFLANSPTAENSTFYPPENYTNLSVKLSDISIELKDLSAVSSCMDSTQVIIQLQLSQANQCLSAYLQPSMFIYGGASQEATEQGSGAGITASTGSGNQAYYKFIQACLIGSASYYITDVCCQLPFESVDESSYGLIREISMMPVPYRSLKSQTDIITSTQGVFTQRINCGGSSLIQAVLCFIKPYFQPPAPGSKLRPQDTMVDYCNNSYVVSASDLRAIPTMDSVYIPYTQASVQCDNKVYNVNPLTPVNNPSYSTYLRSLDLCSQVFNGKVFDVDLRDFLTNRSYIIIPMNTRNSREMMVVDSTLTLTISFDDSARTAYSKAMGLYNPGQSANTYWLQTYIITSQSLVGQDYVKI